MENNTMYSNRIWDNSTDAESGFEMTTEVPVHFEDYSSKYDDNYYYYYMYEDEFYTNSTDNYPPAADYPEKIFKIYDFEPVVLGNIRPALIILTLLANIFVMVYFVSRKRIKKASNLLFTSIALTDTLTGVALLPSSLAIFAQRKTVLSTELCNTYMILRLFVCQVFHTVSVWQTLLLGIQRYMCVCHPFISGRVCTFWKTVVAIIVMFTLAFAMHIHHLFRPLSDQVRCVYTHERPCKGTCIYMWFRAVLQHLLPSVLLVLLTVRTIWTLKKARRRASTIISNRTKNRTSKEKVITITAALIVVCFLIPEMPYGIYQVILVLSLNKVGGLEVSVWFNHVAFSLYEIVLILSFHANFWIYCSMMYEFRQTLRDVFSLGAVKKRVNRIRTLSSSSFRKERSSSVLSRSRKLSRTTSLHSTTSDNVCSIRLTPTPTTENVKIDFPSVNNNSKMTDDDVFV